MATNHIKYLVFLFIFKFDKTIVYGTPQIKKNYELKSHLNQKNVINACINRNTICESNNSRVCGMRVIKDKRFYKDFNNLCQLFFDNMCDFPGDEYYTVKSGSCEEYLIARRAEEEISGTEADEVANTRTEDDSGDGDKDINFGKDNNTDVLGYSVTVSANILRQKSTLSTIYDIDTSYDYHICPLSCPSVYDPVCVNVNRGYGKYFKMMLFVNHCESDVYYCKHWHEFAPPPQTDESVQSSPLGWSFCGASRYIQFARFTEVASSLSHYGWLAGSDRVTHILSPQERMQGYG